MHKRRGVLHADCEAVLLEDGSKQENVWGADWLPFSQQVTFESLINIRPRQNNFSLEVENPGLRNKIERVVRNFMEGVSYEYLEERKIRYMQDNLSVRLGGLAANLARVSSFVKNSSNQEVVHSLLEESKHFIEWTAMETELNTTVELIDLQITLARWQINWIEIWDDEKRRLQIGQKAKELSNKVLANSGLLNKN